MLVALKLDKTRTKVVHKKIVEGQIVLLYSDLRPLLTFEIMKYFFMINVHLHNVRNPIRVTNIIFKKELKTKK